MSNLRALFTFLMVFTMPIKAYASTTIVNLFDSSGLNSQNHQFDKAEIAPDKTQPNNISLEGAYSYQTLNGNTQVEINVASIYNRRSSGISGTLRLELWALPSPYSGGSFSGYKMAQSQLGQLQAGFVYSNIVRTVPFARPTVPGTYYVVLMVTEYSSSQPLNDGFGTVDWGNFSNTLIVTGSGSGGGLVIEAPWTWQVASGNVRVTVARVSNNRTSGVSGTLRLELWALAAPYTGGSFQGYKIGESQFNPLSAGFGYPNIDFTRTASLPPNGTWAIVLMLTEYDSSIASNNGFGVVDYRNSSTNLLVGTSPPPPPPTNTPLQNGIAVTNLAGTPSQFLGFTVQVPANATNLIIETYGGSGDPDLYVRYGTPITNTEWDCRSWAVGTVERCTFATPSAGTYYVGVFGFNTFSGVTIVARWTTSTTTTPPLDEPSYTGFTLPIPNPPFPNCPAGYFLSTVEDGPGAGISPGTFGLALELRPPGTLLLDGGLNFGALLDGSQVAFAGFKFLNATNELQRLTLSVLGSPASNQAGSLPVRIKVIRQPAAGVNELVLETTAIINNAQAFVRTLDLAPNYYVVTVAPEGSASLPGGAADGEVFVALGTQFLNRPGGGFSSGVVVGGYHAAHPFGGVSGFAAICLGTQHVSDARVLAAPTYGAGGARDLRMRLLDNQRREVLRLP